MKIGIFGGTFDPIHEGHLAVARAARDQYGLGKVFFIPAFIPPHKKSRRDLTPAPYRYRMVELAVRNQPHLEIRHIEFDRPEVSYTIETLRALRTEFPQDEFFLIVGADAASEISKWKDAEEIRNRATVVVGKRSKGAISSSEIRRRLSRGEAVGEAFLPKEVEAYIRQMNLYKKP